MEISVTDAKAQLTDLVRQAEVAHRRHGVDIRLGAGVRELEYSDQRVEAVILQDGSRVPADLLIVGAAALTLIFVVMLLITRALVASLVIVGTVLLSLGAAFGLSVLVYARRAEYMFSVRPKK